MLKAIFTLDCDFCREPLEAAAVCCDFEILVWQSFAWDLKTYAQTQGWDYDEKRNRFLCVQCKEQIEEARNAPVVTIQPDSITLNFREAGWMHTALEAYVERKHSRGDEVDSDLEELEHKLSQLFEF